MKSKAGLLNELRKHQQALEKTISAVEASDDPDLHLLSDRTDALRKRREQLDLSPPDVAELCGMSANTYRAFEAGEGNPTLKTLERIGDVLNFTLWIEMK